MESTVSSLEVVAVTEIEGLIAQYVSEIRTLKELAREGWASNTTEGNTSANTYFHTAQDYETAVWRLQMLLGIPMDSSEMG